MLRSLNKDYPLTYTTVLFFIIDQDWTICLQWVYDLWYAFPFSTQFTEIQARELIQKLYHDELVLLWLF